MKTWTPSLFKAEKGRRKLACITAYDYSFARLADAAEIPLILVGDSLGMTMLGHDSTLPVTMDDMLRHTAAVVRGATSHSIVVGDMPFMSYQTSIEDGIRNAGRFLKEANADAVKLEGFYPELISALVKSGIPVVAHLGMTPQSFNVFGGFKVQAKTQDAASTLVEQAKAVSDAGAFAVTLECVPPDVAKLVTESISASTIGIGAGVSCDAQILVLQDLLGMTERSPKFVKRFADVGTVVTDAFRAYASEVEQGLFPAPEHCYKEAGI